LSASGVIPRLWQFQQLATINYKLATDFEAKSYKNRGKSFQIRAKKSKKMKNFQNLY